MGKEYTQVTIEERCEIARLLAKGYSVRQIAAGVDRPPSTVAREMKRNGSRTQGYQPVYADQQAHARRWRGSRLERDGPLREKVLSRLGQGWSPEQVAGRLALDEGRQVISHESIYRFIYSQMARKKDYSWASLPAQGEVQTGLPGPARRQPRHPHRPPGPLNQRPPAAADRATFGHWEGDLMHFGNHGPALLALSERHSRLVLLARLPGKHADVTADTIARLLAPPPPGVAPDHHLRQRHRVRPPLPPPPPGHPDLLLRHLLPLAEGGCGERIGRMRRTLPRKTDLAWLSEKRFTQLVQAYNNTPRKCLGYRTPAEIFLNQVLHLKCESTFPPSKQ